MEPNHCCHHCGSTLSPRRSHTYSFSATPLSKKAYSIQALASQGDCEIDDPIDPLTDEDQPEVPSPLSPMPEPLPTVHSTQSSPRPRGSRGARNRWVKAAGRSVALFSSQRLGHWGLPKEPGVATINLVDELKRLKRVSGHHSMHSKRASEGSSLHVSLDLSKRLRQ